MHGSLQMSANTAEQILDTAEALVQKRGYHAFSYADIAALVGIRKASIHYYYPSKSDLAEALLARAQAQFDERLAALERERQAPAERVRGFAALFRERLAEGDRLCPFCVLATAQESVPEAIRSQIRRFWQAGECWLQCQLEAADLEAPAALARTYIAALEGAMIAARAFDEPRRMDEAMDRLHELVLGGRGARRAPLGAHPRAVPVAAQASR